MALTGTFERTLDEKHRLAVPKRLREQLGGEDCKALFIAPGTDGSLALYAPHMFENHAEQLALKSSNRVEFKNYLRLFYARAERVELDSQSRIRLPERLVQLAGLTRNVMLLGVHDHVEIWDQERWQQFLNQHVPEFDKLATQDWQ